MMSFMKGADTMNKVKLTSGVLSDCYENVRKNILENISPDVHAETYVGDHDSVYAEPEFTGKYLDICMQYLKRGESPEKLRAAAEKVTESIFKNQKPNGNIACLTNDEGWFSVWNQTFTVLGLLSCYRVLGDKRLLDSAMKSADWVIERYGRDDLPTILDSVNDGSEHISFILPMAMLFDATKEKRYGDFLDKLFDYLETTKMNLISFDNILDLMSKKGIEMLVIYLGVLYYGRIIGREEYINAAERYFKQVNDTQIRNTGNGTLVEFWKQNGNAPANIPIEEKPNETCVGVGFSELAFMLFWESEEALYLDAIEKTLFNHILGSMDASGTDFGYYQGNYGTKVFKTAGGYYQCCRYRGYCYFSHLPDMLYKYDGKTLIPCIYTASSFESDGVSVIQKGNYPVSGELTFDVESEKPLTLKLRIPKWCGAYLVRLNGKALNLKNENGFVTLDLPCGKSCAELTLKLDTVVEYGDIDEKKYASVTRGPLLMSIDSMLCDDGAEYDCGGFEEIPTDGEHLVMIKRGDLVLSDYSSAGRVHPGVDTFRVWIPVKGEQKKIVCVGDSLTEGDYGEIRGVGCTHPENYPFFLSRMTGAVTVNYGKCGYTTTDILKMYNEGSISFKDADILIFMLGTNQGLSIDGDTKHLESYKTLIDHAIKDCGKDKIVLVTPPHATEIEGKVNYGFNHFVLNACNEVIKLSEEYDLPLIDLYNDKTLGEPYEEEYQPFDGLHFAAYGYHRIAEIINAGIKEIFPEIFR